MQQPAPHGRTTHEPDRLVGDLGNAATTLCRSQREVPWIRHPQDEPALRAILAEASRERQPVQAISTGRNWGYGSSLPPRNGTALIDLRSWRGIGPLDRATLSVRIQPGVTQGDLYRWLEQHAPDLACNITGAGTQTSIMGCALERGIGYTGAMDDILFGLEVMLPDGTILRPDAPWFHPARNHAVGAAHERLFFQSNYGIVIAARVRLRLRQELEQAAVITGALPELLMLLRECYATGVLTLPTHIGEPGRTTRLASSRLAEVRQRDVTAAEVAAVFPENGDHIALSAMHGRRRIVHACWRELRTLLPHGCVARRFDAASAAKLERFARLLGLRNQADRLASFLPLFGLTWGVPSDAGLQALALPPRQFDPDRAEEGAIYGNAVGALDPSDAARMAGIVRECWADAACTYIVLNTHCLITVFTLHIAPGREADAKRAEQEIARRLLAAGYPPYRLGIELPGPPINPIHRALKTALDPYGIIAPGRYESS